MEKSAYEVSLEADLSSNPLLSKIQDKLKEKTGIPSIIILSPDGATKLQAELIERGGQDIPVFPVNGLMLFGTPLTKRNTQNDDCVVIYEDGSELVISL